MRGNRIESEAEWHSLSERRNELGGWLQQLRVELDTRGNAEKMVERFENLAKEFKEIELRMAH
jgi:hypothetical protein